MLHRVAAIHSQLEARARYALASRLMTDLENSIWAGLAFWVTTEKKAQIVMIQRETASYALAARVLVASPEAMPCH